MAGVTETGFVPKTNEELVEEVTTKANSETEGFGGDFPTTPDSVFGIHTGILSGSWIDLWNLGQDVAIQQNVDTASGVYLDYLGSLNRVTRLVESGSTGDLLFTGVDGTTVSAFFPVSDNDSRSVLTDEELTLTRAGCYTTNLIVNTVSNTTTYSITLQGDLFEYTSTGAATAEEIIQGLYDAIVAGGSALYTTEIVELEALKITYASRNNGLVFTNSSLLSIDGLGGLVNGTATEVGALEFPADTVVNLVGTNLGITSVTNPDAFVLGRLTESDEDYRARIKAFGSTGGTATVPAIEGSLYTVNGVTSVVVLENNTLEEENGIPPKKYLCVVSGGSEDDIAEMIWDTKPATGNTWGDIVKIITDSNGEPQTVRFSRKSDKYAWVRVSYTINDEEVFPSDGEDSMRASVVDYGNSMYSGEDFEPTKFYAPLYQTSGIYVTNIEIAVTDEPTDTPVYQTTRIPVDIITALQFTSDRVTLTTS